MGFKTLDEHKDNNINGRYKFDGNKVFLWVKAHANLTANTPYRLTWTTSGPTTAALADGAVRYKIVVPPEAITSGDSGWVQIEGPVDAMVVPSGDYTAASGNAFKVHDGAITSMGAPPAYSDNELGIFTENGSNPDTSIAVWLYGREALATT